MSEWIEKEEVLKQIDCWLTTGEYKYSNATHYLNKRISSIKPKESGWVSVDDKLPDEDGEYLISMYHRFMIGGIYKKYTGRFVAKYYAEYKEWRIMNDVCTSVTHWMLLPHLPKENVDGIN